VKIRPIHTAAGHALVVTLVVCLCIGIALAAYLNLIKSQTSFAARGQTWNACMALCEAGIEEAMSHLNNPLNTNLVLASDGWTRDGTNFIKTRTIGDDKFTAVIATNALVPPVITCTGYVVAPVTVATSGGFIAAVGPQPGVRYIARVVRATTKREPQFSKALVAKSGIDFNGNNIMVDSYNSNVGPYNPLFAGDKGDVAINNDVVNAGNIGNANIKGKLSVGPKATVKIGPNGVVGSVGWHALGKKGIEAGWLRKDMNVALPDIQAPWSGGAFPPPPDKGNGWDYHLKDGNFETTDFTLAASERMKVVGECSLWVRGNLTLSGYIQIVGSSVLKIYVNKKVTLNANWDKAVDPTDLYIFGLPSCTSVDVSTGARFPAVLYTPQASLKMTGGANFFGAMVVNDITMNGSSQFHYDEALGATKNFRGFVITGWQEL
jgi:hypothetical protein